LWCAARRQGEAAKQPASQVEPENPEHCRVDRAALALAHQVPPTSDLIGSAPDALISTTNDLKNQGWRRGEPWDERTDNFNVLRVWNKARVEAKTIAAFAERACGEFTIAIGTVAD
jgi:hypothetical protein